MTKFLAEAYPSTKVTQADVDKMKLSDFFDCTADPEKTVNGFKRVDGKTPNGMKGCKVKSEIFRIAAEKSEPYIFITLNKAIDWDIVPFKTVDILREENEDTENPNFPGIKPTAALKKWITDNQENNSFDEIDEIDPKSKTDYKKIGNKKKAWFNCYMNVVKVDPLKDQAEYTEDNWFDIIPVKPYLDFTVFSKKDSTDIKKANDESSSSDKTKLKNTRLMVHKQVAIYQIKYKAPESDETNRTLAKLPFDITNDQNVKKYFDENQLKCVTLAKNVQYYVAGSATLTQAAFQDGQGSHVFGFKKIKEVITDSKDEKVGGGGDAAATANTASTKKADSTKSKTKNEENSSKNESSETQSPKTTEAPATVAKTPGNESQNESESGNNGSNDLESDGA